MWQNKTYSSFMHDFQKIGGAEFEQVRSSDDLANFLTEALPTITFEKFVHDIWMRQSVT